MREEVPCLEVRSEDPVEVEDEDSEKEEKQNESQN